MTKTSIEWASDNHNWMVAACSKVSMGCGGCYAERYAKQQGLDFSKVGLIPDWQEKILEPLHWKKPRRVFPNTLSDIFHEEFELNAEMKEARNKAFDVYDKASIHIFMPLTKRPHLMAKFTEERYGEKGSPDHIFWGTSIENESTMFRADILREVKAKYRFISFEPLLGLIISPNLQGISLAIVGGESGPKLPFGPPSPRPRIMRKEWVLELLKACREQNVSFFFKQHGNIGGSYSVKCECHRTWGCRVLDGRTYDEFPVIDKKTQITLESFA